MRNIFTLFYALCFSCSLFGQNFWTATPQEQISLSPAIEKSVDVLHEQTFRLEKAKLEQALKKAPREFTNAAKKKPLLLSMPMPDGSFELFEVVESPVMAPGLAARYPNIKTYSGNGKNNRRLNIRFDLSPRGFHGSILSPKGKIYINPYTVPQSEYYTAFYSSDLQLDGIDMPDLSCGYQVIEEEEEGEHKDTHQRFLDNILTLRNNNTPVNLKTYRFAFACTGEYGVEKGGTLETALASIVTATNSANQIFIQEAAVKLELVENNDEIIFVDGMTDPYSNPTLGGSLLGQNTNVLNTIIGEDKYDIGHLFTVGCEGGLGGVASGANVCTSDKGGGITCNWSNNVEFIATETFVHEVGHQFSCGHSWNNCPGSDPQRSSSNAYEPGSGTTIMSYSGCGTSTIFTSGGRDDYYNIGSLEDFIAYSRIGGGSTCGVEMPTENTTPEVVLDYEDDFYIPIGTPFELKADAIDPDGDSLTFCWEQYDLGPATDLGNPIGTAPSFRSFPPAPGTNRVFPRMVDIVLNRTRPEEVLPTYSRDLTFRCTVRDNNPEAGGTNWKTVRFKATENSGPFLVTSPNSGNEQWQAGEYVEVKWDVANTTSKAINCQRVNIRLSLDGGFTYPITLLENTPNIGSAFVTVPNKVTNSARVRVEASENIFFDISNQDFQIVPPTEPDFSLSLLGVFDRLCLPDVTTFEFATDSLLGFDETISFEIVDGLPDGAIATFSENMIVPSEQTTLTLDFSSFTGAINDTIDVVVRASTDSTNVEERTIRLELVSQNYSDLVLTNPPNGADTIILSTEFGWDPSLSAEGYDFELSTNPLFGATNLSAAEGLTDPNFVPTELLEDNTLYYWRVRPYNICGSGEFTQPFTFHTQTTVCSPNISTDTPKNISGTGTPTVESTLFVEQDGIISDVNIPNIKGEFQPVNSIRISLISPIGTEVILFDQNCGTTLRYDLGFDDEAPSDIICPPDDKIVFRPANPLNVFNGENTIGIWTLRVKVVEPGFGGGGFIDNWELEFCASTSPKHPSLITNDTLLVPRAQSESITNNNLAVQDEDNGPEELVYTVVSLPAYGNIFLENVQLGIGNTFTQADIDNFNIQYQHLGDDEENDNFLFTVVDGSGGFVPIRQFNIKIDQTNSTEDLFDGNNIRVFPNPTSGMVYLSFEEPIRERMVIQLLNVQGQQLLQQQFTNIDSVVPFDVSTLPAGIYVLHLKAQTGFYSQRLVINR